MTTTTQRSLERTNLGRQIVAEIRAMMGRLGMNQAELARELEVSQAWVSDRLLGKTAITIDELDQVQELLGHASPSSTAIYTEITDGQLWRRIRKLPPVPRATSR